MIIKDKVVLITGACNAIGTATAVLFANRSAKLVLVDENAEKLDELKTMSIISGECHTFCANTSDPEQVTKLQEEVKAAVGNIDILVNNENVGNWGKFMNMSMEDIIAVVNKNTIAGMLTTRTFLPDMIAAKSGKIVNVSSLYARVTSPNLAVYSASKSALLSLGEALRIELETSNIEVMNVLATPLESDFDHHSAQINDLKMGSPEEIAETILRACSKNKKQMVAGTYGSILMGVNTVIPALSESITRQMARSNGN